MRILMVTNTYAPARNGVAIWVSLSVRELRRQGHHVGVLTFAHDRRMGSDDHVSEVPAWLGIDPDFKVAPVPRALPEAVGDGAWDVVHVHHPVLLGPAGVSLGRRCGAKVAFTCHSVYSDYFEQYYWGAGRFLKRSSDRRAGRFADRCDVTFAPSTRVASWLSACGARCRIESLEAPADTDRIDRMDHATARSLLGIGDAPTVLYVGRIADEKRVQELVSEFAIVRQRVPGAVLALAGSGRKLDAVRRDVERGGLKGSVRLLGAVDADVLSRWYSAADVSVSASRSEAGPLTVVEAMACGCPTVSLRVPGFEDRIVDGVNGLFAEDRPGGLADTMVKVLLDRDLRERLSRGSLERAPRYAPATVTTRMMSVYESLLD